MTKYNAIKGSSLKTAGLILLMLTATPAQAIIDLGVAILVIGSAAALGGSYGFGHSQGFNQAQKAQENNQASLQQALEEAKKKIALLQQYPVVGNPNSVQTYITTAVQQGRTQEINAQVTPLRELLKELPGIQRKIAAIPPLPQQTPDQQRLEEERLRTMSELEQLYHSASPAVELMAQFRDKRSKRLEELQGTMACIHELTSPLAGLSGKAVVSYAQHSQGNATFPLQSYINKLLACRETLLALIASLTSQPYQDSDVIKTLEVARAYDKNVVAAIAALKKLPDYEQECLAHERYTALQRQHTLNLEKEQQATFTARALLAREEQERLTRETANRRAKALLEEQTSTRIQLQIQRDELYDHVPCRKAADDLRGTIHNKNIELGHNNNTIQQLKETNTNLKETLKAHEQTVSNAHTNAKALEQTLKTVNGELKEAKQKYDQLKESRDTSFEKQRENISNLRTTAFALKNRVETISSAIEPFKETEGFPSDVYQQLTALKQDLDHMLVVTRPN